MSEPYRDWPTETQPDFDWHDIEYAWCEDCGELFGISCSQSASDFRLCVGCAQDQHIAPDGIIPPAPETTTEDNNAS